ncbi:MAG TPA: sugar phosphate isomerase/epimerase family protein [Casimicrobiaceae bacterium]|nr:sugar phosphate isomerase/epimerase family protein [Casimicrobiaceae bacterium]
MDRAIGLAALTVLELAPPDIVTCAAQAGYDCVGLRLLPATETETRHPIVGDTPMLRETAKRLADTGLRLLDIELFRLEPDTDVREYRAALEAGARLGAREALVAGNDPDEQRLVDRFGAFCDLAAGFGIGANLEPMPWSDVRDFAQAARIVGAVGRDSAGLVIDPIHFDRGGSRPEEIASLPARHLHYMQLCDAPAERPADIDTIIHQARAERLMPGDGGLDLRGILRAVPPGIPVSVEIPMRTLSRSAPALERGRQMLAKTRQLLQSL